MSIANEFKSVIVTIALVLLLHATSGRSVAAVDVLAGLPWTSATGVNNFGSSNPTHNLTFTDGAAFPSSNSNAGTFDYIGYDAGATVVYDLGSPTLTAQFGIWMGLGSLRGGPALVTINRSNSPTFSSGVTTDVVNLIDNLDGSHTGAYYQLTTITDATAQYVRFILPVSPNFVGAPTFTGMAAYANSSDGYYHVQSDPNFATVSELQLFAPEPGSLSLLALGGVALLRKRTLALGRKG